MCRPLVVDARVIASDVVELLDTVFVPSDTSIQKP